MGLVRNLCLPCFDGCATGSLFCWLIPKLADEGGLEMNVSIASCCRSPALTVCPKLSAIAGGGMAGGGVGFRGLSAAGEGTVATVTAGEGATVTAGEVATATARGMI